MSLRPTVGFRLRSQHVAYLERMAENEDTSLSRAFGAVVEEYAARLLKTQGGGRSPRKVHTNLWVKPEHLSLLDALAVQSGLYRSEMARRLIDTALAENPPLVGCAAAPHQT